jgi:hypothetical protein
MISQFVGKIVGLAKKVNMIPVQYYRHGGEQELLDALTAVLNDIGAGNKQAVLS